MRADFNSDLDGLADVEDTAEFKRSLVGINADHRQILRVLLPKLAALQERGDAAAALGLIAEIKRIIVGEEDPLH